MIALLCSGQGRQHAGMFRLTHDSPAATAVFGAARAALGRDAERFVADAPSDALQANRAAQILCVAQALALHAALGDALPARRLVAGYSVGAVAAWSIAGCIDPAAAVALAAQRAVLMDAAGGPRDGLAYVRGLPPAVITAAAEAFGIAIAIVNPGNVYVVGGGHAALEAFCAAALAQGAVRVGMLPIATASHTPRLGDAVAPLAAALRAAAPRTPATGTTLFAGSGGVTIAQADPAWLARQVAAPLDWAGCLDALVERGMTAALELGPGRALAEMAGVAAPAIPVRSADDFQSLEGLASWIATVLPDD